MTLTVGGRGAHLQVLLLVVALWNRVAGRRVLPRQQQQAAAAPAEGGRAEGSGGPRGARFWAGRRFGERTASVWTLERADGWEVLYCSVSHLYRKPNGPPN